MYTTGKSGHVSPSTTRMMPGKKIKDTHLSPSASPPPSLQTPTRRKSRAEQINFRLPSAEASPVTTSVTFQKRKKHWRSPSNPLDFHLNCELVTRTAGIQSDTNKQTLTTTDNTTPYNNTNINTNNTTTTNSMMIPVTRPLPLPPLAPCQSTQQPAQPQLNFSKQQTRTTGSSQLSTSKSGNFKDLKVPEMTVINSEKRDKSSLHSYETMLLRSPGDHKFKMIAELSISPIVSTGSSDYTSTRRHVFTFDSSYCRADSSADSSSFDSTSLAHGHITEQPSKKPVTFSRCSLLQVILRNPQDNSVAGIFVVKLELSDMPAESRTILRQKAYKSKCLADDSDIDTAPDYLSKFIEIPLKRSYDPEAKRQRIHLAGPIRVAFSFNRSNLRYTSPRKSDASAVEPAQKTRTVLQFPCKDQKYFPLSTAAAVTNHERLRSNSLTTDNATRSFQHGSLCL